MTESSKLIKAPASAPNEWASIIPLSGFWFSKGAMRFFDSRILWQTLTRLGKGYLFVSSEQFDYRSPRLYTVRKWDNGDVSELGEFQQFETRGEALAAIKKAVI